MLIDKFQAPLAMCADEHFFVVQVFQVVMLNDAQAFGFQPFHLLIVMNNIAQAIQVAVFGEYLFGHVNGIHHPKSKSPNPGQWLPVN